MKKVIIITISVILLIVTGCSNKDEKVTLTVENEYLSYVDSSETIWFNNYKNDSIRKKATNLITYTITNPTDKKLLFVFDKEEMYPSSFSEHKYSGFMGFYIKDANGEFLKPSMSMITWGKNALELLDCEFYQDSIKAMYYKQCIISNWI